MRGVTVKLLPIAGACFKRVRRDLPFWPCAYVFRSGFLFVPLAIRSMRLARRGEVEVHVFRGLLLPPSAAAPQWLFAPKLDHLIPCRYWLILAFRLRVRRSVFARMCERMHT